MKNFQIGDILRYNKGLYIINYFLVMEKKEIKSHLHHSGYYIEYKIMNLNNGQTASLSSDNKLMYSFVRENE